MLVFCFQFPVFLSLAQISHIRLPADSFHISVPLELLTAEWRTKLIISATLSVLPCAHNLFSCQWYLHSPSQQYWCHFYSCIALLASIPWSFTRCFLRHPLTFLRFQLTLRFRQFPSGLYVRIHLTSWVVRLRCLEWCKKRIVKNLHPKIFFKSLV